MEKHPRLESLPLMVNYHKGKGLFNEAEENKAVVEYRMRHPDSDYSDPFDETQGPIIKIPTDPSEDIRNELAKRV